MIGPYRNNSIVIFDKLALSVAVAAVMCLLFSSTEFIICMVSAAAVLDFIWFRVWYRTSYTFDDTGISISKTTAFKKDVSIPYTKISSVNIVRSIRDRIVGTSTLQVNINSGVNAAIPEMTLVLRRDLAAELHYFLDSKLQVNSDLPTEGPMHEIKKIEFNDMEVILHGLLCNPTGSLIVSALFLIYSIFGLNSETGSISGLFSLLVFIFNLVMPMIKQVITYFNFTVYRDGDRIYLEHGLFTKYHSSFDVHRINAVRIRQPLFARIFGLSFVQAEVVGINAVSVDTTPVLCLMSSDKKFRRIMDELIPEFVYEAEFIRQPSESKAPVFIKSLLYSSITIVTAIVIIIVMNVTDIDRNIAFIVSILAAVSAIVLTIIFVVCGFKSLEHKGIKFGDDIFTMVDGVVDRNTTILYYDNVQKVEVRNGPLSRHYGLSVCAVSFLSSSGNMGSAKIGYLGEDNVHKVGETVMRRLRDGIYKYNDV